MKQIWVDADACPKVIKETLFRAAARVEMPLILVANQPMQHPRSPYIRAVQVGAGFDVADNYIVEQLEPDDLVITADIPLAAEVIEKGGLALNPRGELYSEVNIRQRLTMRNFMAEMRDAGIATGGPPPISQKERRDFANELDKLLVKSY
ncbi:MAG: YaiI/YqxD family protein [Chromatiales bacterium]|nr:YaiI/YqxD family protein [Chromatiales bacterium]